MVTANVLDNVFINSSKGHVLNVLSMEERERIAKEISKSLSRKTIGKRVVVGITLSFVLASSLLMNNNSSKPFWQSIDMDSVLKGGVVYSSEDYSKKYYDEQGNEIIGTLYRTEAKALEKNIVSPVSEDDILLSSNAGEEDKSFEPYYTIYVPKGEKVKAPGDGTVVSAKEDKLILKHDADGVTCFTELVGVDTSLKKGDKVKTNKEIGETKEGVLKFALSKTQGSEYIAPSVILGTEEVDPAKEVLASFEDEPTLTFEPTKEEIKSIKKQPHGEIILKVSEEVNTNPTIVANLIESRSGFDTNAVSKDGGMGLMGLTEATAKSFGVEDINDPEQNIRAGARLLKSLTNKYDNPELAIKAYSVGQGNVDRWVSAEAKMDNAQNTDSKAESSQQTTTETATQVVGKSDLDLPIESGKFFISNVYGLRYYPGNPTVWGDDHKGVDLAATKGTPYMATADGIVRASNASSSAGWIIQIEVTEEGEHKGKILEYMHSDSANDVFVKVGQTVKRGEVIGLVGNGGGSFGYHLHYGVGEKAEGYGTSNYKLEYSDPAKDSYELQASIGNYTNREDNMVTFEETAKRIEAARLDKAKEEKGQETEEKSQETLTVEEIRALGFEALLLTENSSKAEIEKVKSYWWQLALEASKRTGWDPNFIMAQWEIETTHFTSDVLRDNKNPAGLTWWPYMGEDKKGTARPQSEGGFYIKCDDPLEAYVDFIKSNPRYNKVKTYDTAEEQAAEVAAQGWADSDHYQELLASRIETNRDKYGDVGVQTESENQKNDNEDTTNKDESKENSKGESNKDESKEESKDKPNKDESNKDESKEESKDKPNKDESKDESKEESKDKPNKDESKDESKEESKDESVETDKGSDKEESKDDNKSEESSEESKSENDNSDNKEEPTEKVETSDKNESKEETTSKDSENKGDDSKVETEEEDDIDLSSHISLLRGVVNFLD